MKTISTFWLALAIGATMEAGLCGLFARFGRFGPCGPGNDFTGIFVFIHLPAMRAAESILPQSSSVELPALVVVTAASFCVAAYVAIHVVRRFYATVKTPAAEQPGD